MMLVAAGLMTGCGKDSEETPTKPEDPGDPIPPVTTTYEIGDYYENGFVKGIVIYIDSEGKSGTVVSLDETEAVWSYKYEEPMASFPQTGRYNTDCVYNMEGWRENYPGFLWCSEKDVMGVKNWYVPDQRELGLLYEAYSGVRGRCPVVRCSLLDFRRMLGADGLCVRYGIRSHDRDSSGTG